MLIDAWYRKQGVRDAVHIDVYAAEPAPMGVAGPHVSSAVTQLLAATNSQAMSQMAGWVGDQARIDAPVYYDGAPITLSPNPGVDATKETLVVTDATGVEVDRRDLPAVSSEDDSAAVLARPGAPLPTHHSVPWRRAAPPHVCNLHPACATCNNSKGDRTPEEWMR